MRAKYLTDSSAAYRESERARAYAVRRAAEEILRDAHVAWLCAILAGDAAQVVRAERVVHSAQLMLHQARQRLEALR